MNVLMMAKSRYRDDVRVRREAEALAAAGHTVTVVALDEDDLEIHGVEVVGIGEVTGLRPGGRRRLSPLHRALRWLLLPEHRARATRQFQDRALEAVAGLGHAPDVVHAHDFPALEPAVAVADAYRARLVYDSHELWSGTPRYGRPEPIRRERFRSIEERLAKRADAVITVSPAAASLIADRLGIDEVTVVRNTFPARQDLTVTAAPGGAVYVGRIGPGRDLETVFASSVWADQGLELRLMGPVEPGFEVGKWAHLHDPGSLDEVDRLLAQSGIALVTLSRGPVNHDIALPNKLFQAVAVGVPVVAADLPQLGQVVRAYRLGAVYRPGDPESLGEAVIQVRREYQAIRAAVVEARLDLDWTVDAATLRQVYRRLEPV